MENTAEQGGMDTVVSHEHTLRPDAVDAPTAPPSQSVSNTHSPPSAPVEPSASVAPAAATSDAPVSTTPPATTTPAETHTAVDPNKPSELSRDQRPSKTIYDFQVLDCYHELYDLSQHKGHCVLIVNVASKSKDSTQSGYEMLQTLYQRYRHTGFTVLAFPCNEFGNAEPDEADQIAELLSYAYPSLGDIEFPIMAKVEVNGSHELPLFAYLKSSIRGTIGQEAIRWNFSVFLIDKEGYPRYRFPPNPAVADVDKCLQVLLNEDPTASAAPQRSEVVSPEEQALQQTERSLELGSTTDTIPGVDDSANADANEL